MVTYTVVKSTNPYHNPMSKFISFHFYPPDLQESDGGIAHRASDYPDLFLETPRYY